MLAFALLGLLLTFAGSCARQAFNRAYHEVVEREVEQYRHKGSIDELHRDIEAYLTSKGFVIASSSTARIETDWQTAGDDARKQVRVQLLIHPEGLQARFFEVWQDLTPQQYAAHSLERRGDLERELHERLVTDADERGEAKSFVYERPAADIWKQLQAVVDAEPGLAGFEQVQPPVDSIAVTSWTTSEAEAQRSRLEVRLQRRGTNRYAVEINERTERATGERRWQTRSDQHELALELEFIRMRDPLHVQAIEEDAKAAGDAAFDATAERWGCYCAL